MYILPDRIYSEFLATPVLIRLVRSLDDQRASLLIKATTLDLHYISRLSVIRLRFFRPSPDRRYIAYALTVDVGGESFVVWSIAEWLTEIAGIQSLLRDRSCKVYLFNELAVNVAEATFSATVGSLAEILTEVTLYERPDPRGEIPHDVVQADLSLLRSPALPGVHFNVSLERGSVTWTELKSIYITDAGKLAPLALFSSDEGAEQEQLANWLVSHLQPERSVRNPRFRDGAQWKELTDLLIMHAQGYFLVESKALSVLGRSSMPTRVKLRIDVEKDVHKAVRQLGGAIRSIRRRVSVIDADGVPIDLNVSSDAPHLIVLVPDLSLLQGFTDYGGESLGRLAQKYSAFIHVLDPKELLRVIQAGGLMVDNNDHISSEGQAIDSYLVRRFQYALTRPDPNFQVLARVGGS